MTEEEAFKLLAVEALGGFGWSVTVDDIADMQSIEAVYGRLIHWWNALDQDTRDLIGEFDLATGFWNKSWLNEWPTMYTLLSGNPFGRFRETLDNVRSSLVNARDRAPDYAAQHGSASWPTIPRSQGNKASSDASADRLVVESPHRRRRPDAEYFHSRFRVPRCHRGPGR